jgi:SIR2-like domain
MSNTVVFLGAGATKACSGPLTSEILPQIYAQESRSNGDPHRLAAFLEEQFHIRADSSNESFPGLPLLLSLMDTAIDRKQAFSNNWDAASISALRQRMEFGIYNLLESLLQSAQTNNHWTLFNELYPLGQEEPCIISTNYDLIADTALMFLSEGRPLATGPSEGRLPDYRCRISTPFYKNEPARFGTLLKLHGSLNWLYCSTCSRLEMGISTAKRFLKVLGRMAGQDLDKAFTADGDPCPTCTTRLRPLLIAPSHLKYYRNPHLSQVWYEAESVLREAQHVIFIGYSLPEDDVEVVYLLKRALSRSDAPRVTVVEYDPNPEAKIHESLVGRRYRTIFGDAVEWHACGLDAWLVKLQNPAAVQAPVPSITTPVSGATAPPAWPSFTGVPQLVGTSPSGRVSVYVDPTLGQPALQNAQDLLADSDRIVSANDLIFGSVGSHVDVVVFAMGGATDGTGGADHLACDYTTGGAIEVDASFGNSQRVSALFEAELSECSMGGNLCGYSTGEALSRWCAAVVSNNALADFAVAPQWYAQGMPDFVNTIDLSDQNPVSTGCGMAFLSWLMSQAYPLSAVAQAMVALGDSGTLAQLYAKLTSAAQTDAWPKFQAAVQALGAITNDDPFRALHQPAHLAALSPSLVELGGRVFATILTDLAAGHTEHQMIASIRAVLTLAPAPSSQGATASGAAAPVCATKSHRLTLSP